MEIWKLQSHRAQMKSGAQSTQDECIEMGRQTGNSQAEVCPDRAR